MAVKANRIIRVIVIALLAVVTSGFLYLMVNNFQFTKGVSAQVHFKSVGDLVAGGWVRKAGIKIGSITKIQPAEDEKTVIVTIMMKPGQIVRSTDRFSLISKGILGDQFVEVKPGPKDSPLAEEGQIFQGDEPLNLTDMLGGDTMKVVTDLVDSISKISGILARNSETLDVTLRDLQKTVSNARQITDDVAVVTATVPPIARRIMSSVDSLQKTVDELSDATSRTVKTLEGTIDSGAGDLTASLKSIRASVTDIQVMTEALSGKGSIIQTLSSPDTSRSVSDILKNLQEISKGLLKTTQDAQTIVEGVSTIFKNP